MDELEARREANVQALLANSLQVQRQPLLSKYLSIKEGEQVLRRQFKSPAPGAPARSDALRKRLLARKHFVPWGASKPFVHPALSAAAQQHGSLLQQQQQPLQPEPPETLPPGIEPLILWEPSEPAAAAAAGADGSETAAAAATAGGGAAVGQGGGERAIEVDPMLTRWLRPHQREGVQFMFDCVCGLRLAGGQGCILADDMGLGKTLQGITLLWTLLQQGSPALGGVPLARRAIIVCPTSLVSNWAAEFEKFLKGRCRTLPLCESSREDVVDTINTFVSPPTRYGSAPPAHCLIISYETFRLHAARLAVPGACDLLICDEAHRLKNDATLTNRALDSLPCKRRVLLSGTPMQNHLDEFYAMVDFCNPGCLGTPAEFRKHFESPILAGREPGASPAVSQLGEERSTELSALVNNFILRRTNKLLSDHLPPKVVQVVCCRLTPLQQSLYEHFLLSTATRRLLSGSKATGVLSAITCLKKLCNHPKLIYDTLHSKAQADGTVAEGFEGIGELMPPGLFDNGRPGRGEMALGWEELSGKLALVARLLAVLRQTCDDKVVIVSNYTQTLDLFATLCRQRGYQFVRLDGSTSISKRQKLVQQLNALGSQVFVFLLSSKAGGCGLNLVGANRLILFDPDWNPATDKQAAARVWRDGQKKRVYVYRLLSAGSIEEKVFQRQISKEGLQQVVDNAAAAGGDGAGDSGGGGGGSGGGGGGGSSIFGAGADEEGGRTVGKGPNMSLMSAEELRQLFSLRADVASDTYEAIRGGAERAAAAAAAAAAVGPAGTGAGAARGAGRGKQKQQQQQCRRAGGRRRAMCSSGESDSEADSIDLAGCSSESESEESEGLAAAADVSPGRLAAGSPVVVAAAAAACTSSDCLAAVAPADPAAADANDCGDTSVEAAAAVMGEDAATQGMAALAMVDGYRPQVGAPSEEDLQHFGHHTAEALATVPDEALRAAAAAGEAVVTFVFSNQVAGRLDICSGQQQQQQQPAQQQQQLRGPPLQQATAGTRPGSSMGLGVPRQALPPAGLGCGSSAGGMGLAGRKGRVSAPAALPSKRPLVAAAGGQPVLAGVGAGCGQAGQQQQQQQRRHSTPAAAAAGGAAGSGHESMVSALADASSKLNRGASHQQQQSLQQEVCAVSGGMLQVQQPQQHQKRQKIQLKKPTTMGGGRLQAAAAAAAVVEQPAADGWGDEEDDDEFM